MSCMYAAVIGFIMVLLMNEYISMSCIMHAAVIAFIMVLLMRFLAAIIVWVIVVLAAVGSLGLYIQAFSAHFAFCIDMKCIKY